MERLTISMSEEFAAELASFMDKHGYDNRSEAVRDLARIGLTQAMVRAGVGECVATLSYVYDHRSRELPRRLTDMQHAHHDLQVSTLHVHLDHETCLEVAVLRGDSVKVQDFANTITTERGVNHGALSVIPVNVDRATHTHGADGRGFAHDHSRPKP